MTGAHSIKVGYQYRQLDLLDKDVANSTQLGYRFNQGVPNAVSYYLPDFGRRTITKTHSIFVQDSWTRSRLTLQGALRWDRASSYAPVELNGTTNTSFLNPQPITIQQTPGVDAYNDITPRVGVAYDVFGNGQDGAQVQLGQVPGVRGERLAVYVHEPRRDDRPQRARTAAGPTTIATWW